LVVLTELRGIDEKDVNIEADENSVTITAQNAARRYFKIVRLPTGINKDTAEFTCRNNILQLRLRKLREKAQSGQH
jgi:HSP20 family molecular chaperone IbpA